MGQIHLAEDDRVGRSVALKVMLDESLDRPDARWRFLREARVQGQLEHPAIVPVYDIGTNRSGRPYFAMKRIGGVTLAEVLRELRAGNAEFERKYSLRRLLSTFQQVCLAVDYAHVRGVVHRDIKPSNVMFGDFGEVYVLDWGIAKVLEGDDPVSARVHADTGGDADATSLGEVLGTVGFMAPEQITDATNVDARADVYALGAVLFYMLALEPLHGRGSIEDRARSTQLGCDARPSVRAPHRDVPPELDRVCQIATALDPTDRYASARELHDAIERFLEGDRDVRLRDELATAHVEVAREAADRALSATGDAVEDRKVAIREAGRALALDPKNQAAAGIVARLMLEPPRELPREVRQATDALFHSEVQRGARLGALVMLGIALTTALIAWTGVRSWIGFSLIIVPLLVAAAASATMYDADARTLRRRSVMLTVLLCLAIAGSTGLVGGLLLAPVYALAFAAIGTVLHGLGRVRFLMVALACAAWVVPSLLEWAGVLPETYRFSDGVLTIIPQISNAPEVPTRIALITANLGTIVFVSALLWRVGAAIAESRERVEVTAWHLRQLAPDAAPPREPAPSAGEGAADDVTRR